MPRNPTQSHTIRFPEEQYARLQLGLQDERAQGLGGFNGLVITLIELGYQVMFGSKERDEQIRDQT